MYNAAQSAAAANSAIKVYQFKHSYNQPSVIAKFPGTTSSVGTYPNHRGFQQAADGSAVIVSAHYDSINEQNPAGRAPGTDDNASGVVVVLEALRVLADAGFSPKNSLEFHFYSGEEGRSPWLARCHEKICLQRCRR